MLRPYQGKEIYGNDRPHRFVLYSIHGGCARKTGAMATEVARVGFGYFTSTCNSTMQQTRFRD